MPVGLVAELRGAVELIAQQPDTDPGERARGLRDLRTDLVDLLGEVDSYLARVEKAREARAALQAQSVARMYEDADLREEMLHRNLATPDELDQLGLYERAEIARLEEEGLLLEAAAELEELRVPWGSKQEALHPRGRGGQWIERIGDVGIRSSVASDAFEAVGPHGEYALRPTLRQARRAARQMARSGGRKRRRERQDPGEPFRAESEAPFQRDPAIVEQARAHILSGAPTTRDMYAREVGGRLVYDESRRALHEQIIDAFLHMDRDGNPGKGKRHHRPEGRKPRVFFTGGGYASGKGGIVDGYGDDPPHEWKPEDAIVIDPDKVKAMLPEYGELQRAGDPEANLRAWAEAWDVSQAIAARVQEENLDAIVDGVGDTTPEEMLARVKSWTDAGYEVPRAVYVTKDVDVAIKTARERMERAMAEGKLESIRWIPDDMMRDVHGQVAKAFPGILEGFPGDMELYESFDRDPKTGEFPDPKPILRKVDGKVEIADQEAYDRFLARKSLTPED